MSSYKVQAWSATIYVVLGLGSISFITKKQIILPKEHFNHGVLSVIICILEPFNRIGFHILASNGRYQCESQSMDW